MASDFFAHVVNVNLHGTFRMADFGSPRNPACGASKAAVVQLTKSLATRSRTDPAHVAAVNLLTPMGRWGRPEDTAAPVLVQASDPVGLMTGTCLAIVGGYSVA